jgi:hypothetical protein
MLMKHHLWMQANMNNPFSARWSATGSNLCTGHWEILHNGRLLALDASWRESDMGTYGIWHIFRMTWTSPRPERDEWLLSNIDWVSQVLPLDIPSTNSTRGSTRRSTRMTGVAAAVAAASDLVRPSEFLASLRLCCCCCVPILVR